MPTRSIASDSTILRERLVKTNFELITRTKGQALNINLFENVTYKVVIEQSETRRTQPSRGNKLSPFGKIENILDPTQLAPKPLSETLTTQFGRIQGVPESEVYLSTQGDRLFGTVRLPTGELYEIRPAADNLQVIREINPKTLQPDHPPGAFQKMQQSTSTRSPRGCYAL
jgi:hypothetical protein